MHVHMIGDVCLKVWQHTGIFLNINSLSALTLKKHWQYGMVTRVLKNICQTHMSTAWAITPLQSAMLNIWGEWHPNYGVTLWKTFGWQPKIIIPGSPSAISLGKLNTESDSASHFLNERTEWEFNPATFRKIFKKFLVAPSIDLFTSRLNRKLPVYASFSPDPFCSFMDAFTFSWSKFQCVYTYPSFNLLSRTLAKIRQDGATTIIICPCWPNQPWFFMMLNMLVEFLCLLPPSELCLTLPCNLNIPHPNSKNLRLLSVVLCGIDTCVKGIPEQVASDLIHGHWFNSHRGHSAHTKRWFLFCQPRKIDPL